MTGDSVGAESANEAAASVMNAEIILMFEVIFFWESESRMMCYADNQSLL